MRGPVCVVATFVFILACAFGGHAGALPTGAVYLTTLPAGADVWLDGTYVGRTPVLIDALAQGKHAVTLTKTGWAVEETDVAVPAGGTALASIRLNAQRAGTPVRGDGSYVLRGLPKGAHAVVDGMVLSHDPLTAMPAAAGTHVVTMTVSATRLVRTFTVLPGMTTQVLLRPEATGTAKTAVVAPADEFLPDGSYTVQSKKVVIRYEGHKAVGHLDDSEVKLDGATLTCDAAPTLIGRKLYLPLELLAKLNALESK